MMAVIVDFLILTAQVFGHILHALIHWVKKPREKRVRNEICLITGAAILNGIGRLFALEFARRGAILVLWDVDAEGNENTAREVRRLGAKTYTYTCDVSRREVVYGAADCVRREVGHVSILINNAGVVSGKPILQSSDEELEKTMRTNCHAHFWTLEGFKIKTSRFIPKQIDVGPCNHWFQRDIAGPQKHYSFTIIQLEIFLRGFPVIQTVKAFLPQMIKRRHGHIVTIAGSLGLFATGWLEDYCASQFAVVGFHEALSHELKAKRVNGVKTTLVCPYFIDTGMFHGCGIRQELKSLLPPLKRDHFVKTAVQGILRNQHMICIPRVIYLAAVSKQEEEALTFLCCVFFVNNLRHQILCPAPFDAQCGAKLLTSVYTAFFHGTLKFLFKAS